MTATAFRNTRKGPDAYHWRFLNLAFPHWGFWAITIGILLVDALLDLTLPNIEFSPECYRPVLIYIFVAIGAMVWRSIRFESFDWFTHRAWCLVMLIAWVAATSKAVGILGFGLTALRLPIFSDHLIASDKALGFDWNSYTRVILSNPSSEGFFFHAYNDIADGAIKAIFAIPILLNNRARILEATFLASATGLACSVIGALAPAYPAFNTVADPAITQHLLADGHFSLSGVAYFSLVLRIAPHTLVTPDMLVGLVNFPSYHCCVALIIIVCSRGLGAVSYLAAAIGIAIILSTPAFGGHYFTDLLGGAAIFTMCAFAWHKLFSPRIATALPGTTKEDFAWPSSWPLLNKLAYRS